MYSFYILTLMFSVGFALPQPEINSSQNHQRIHDKQSFESTARSLKDKECSNGGLSLTCFKIEALSMLERINEKEEISILPGVTVVKEDGNSSQIKAEQVAAELSRSMPGNSAERLDKFLLYRLGSFLDSHSIKFKLLDEKTAEEARELANGEARKGSGGLGGGGGKKGGMGGMMAMAMMMKGTMMSMALGGLALMAGKALMTAMLSLLLSGVIGLKSLTSGGGKSTTYEIVTKPVYSHSHSHSGHEENAYGGHSGYGRSFEQNVKQR